MSHKINRRVLNIRARILGNTLAVISLAGFLAACAGNGNKDENSSNDSIAKIKEQQRLDSLAKANADSIEEARYDSIARVKEDSLLKAQGKPHIKPAVSTGTKYGVPRDIQTKYGVPQTDMN